MCTKELQVVDTHGQTKYIGIGTGLVKEEFQKQPCKINGLGDVYRVEQEGFLPCQTPTSSVGLKVVGCRVGGVELGVYNRGCRIESAE